MDAFTKDFTSDIARGVTTRFLDRQSVPQARWEPCEKIMGSRHMAYDPASPGAKILVGALNDRLIGIDDNRHVMTIAGSRTGKSVTLVNNLLFYRGSVLALDPKGELAAITAERRGALGQQVCILYPFHIAPDRLMRYRTSFNPLSLLSPESDTIIEDAGLISDALVIAGGKDPHWDDSAQSWIEGLLLHIATDPTFEGRRNLATLRALLRTVFVTADEGDDAPFTGARSERSSCTGILPERSRLFQSLESGVSIPGLRSKAGISNLVGGAFAAAAFSNICHKNRCSLVVKV